MAGVVTVTSYDSCYLSLMEEARSSVEMEGQSVAEAQGLKEDGIWQ